MTAAAPAAAVERLPARPRRPGAGLGRRPGRRRPAGRRRRLAVGRAAGARRRLAAAVGAGGRRRVRGGRLRGRVPRPRLGAGPAVPRDRRSCCWPRRRSRAAGTPRAAEVLTVLATAVSARSPCSGSSRTASPPGSLRGLEATAVVAGLVAVVATVGRRAGRRLVRRAGGRRSSLFCAGWLLFERSTGDERRRVLWAVLGVCPSVPTASMFLAAADPHPARRGRHRPRRRRRLPAAAAVARRRPAGTAGARRPGG